MLYNGIDVVAPESLDVAVAWGNSIIIFSVVLQTTYVNTWNPTDLCFNFFP